MQTFIDNKTSYVFAWHDNVALSIAKISDKIECEITNLGLSINIAENVILNKPIILLNTAKTKNKSQNQINIGQNSQVQIIEYMLSEDTDANNEATSTITCGKNTKIQHCVLLQASKLSNINQFAKTTILQEQSSDVTTHLFSLHGNLHRTELNIILNGQMAQCKIFSLAHTKNAEIQQVLLNIEHESPHCNSKCTVRSVLADESKSDFSGKITVQVNAHKTSADLQIKNLLCSPSAQTINKPELEIYNEDVRCSHGASTGQLDKTAIFYMRSRGIDEEAAHNMLIASFIQPVIKSCNILPVADYIEAIIAGA